MRHSRHLFLEHHPQTASDRGQPDATPGDLLAELFRVHELSRAEQSLVALLAKNERLALTGQTFLSEPGPLDRAIEAADPDAPRSPVLSPEAIRLLELSVGLENRTWEL